MPRDPGPRSMLDRAAMAILRVELGLVTPRVRQEARDVLRGSGDEFDGQRLVELCLEGQAGDGSGVLTRALLALRSRLIGVEAHVPRRRPSLLVRLTATATAKLLFFGLYTFLILVVVFLVKKNWPEADLYQVGDKVLSFFEF